MLSIVNSRLKKLITSSIRKSFYINLIIVRNRNKVNIRTSIFTSSRDIFSSSISNTINRNSIIILIIVND